jgi:hypothetical protein
LHAAQKTVYFIHAKQNRKAPGYWASGKEIMMNYVFKLHNTSGDQPIEMVGGLMCHGMIFVDDGMGEMISVDVMQYLSFFYPTK